MQILVITDLYPITSNEKFTPKTIQNFVKIWREIGHDISVIRPNFVLNSFLRGKKYYKSGFYNDIENINYFLPFLGNVKNKIHTNLDVDLIIAHMPSGIILANKLGKPFVAGVHVSDIEVLTNPLYSIYFKKELLNAYKNATKIACRSEIIRNKFLTMYPELEHKTFVGYSGINENLIIKRNWKPHNKIKILTCANLIKRKNIDKLIIACEKLKNVELTIIGEGREEKYLKTISEKPIFLGYLPSNIVYEKMRDADIFVLPSQNETFGMVYLEAMASGCITVGIENEGIAGIIKNGINGYLTNLNNLKEDIEKIINSDSQNIILEESYKTILKYTEKKAALNYLNNVKVL